MFKVQMAVKRKPILLFCTLLISFILWEAASFLAGAAYFPHIWVVLADLAQLVISVAFWNSLILTLLLTSIAFVVGVVCASAIAIMVALNRSGELATRGVLNFVRSIPSVVFLPLLVASVGSSAKTAVLLAAFVVTFKLVTYIIRGIGETDPRLLDVAKVMNLSFFTKIWLVYLPSTIALASTGLRLSASRAFGTVVATGIIAGTPGLGLGLLTAETNANNPRLFTYVLVMGVVGVWIYRLFTTIENQLFRWRRSV